MDSEFNNFRFSSFFFDIPEITENEFIAAIAKGINDVIGGDKMLWTENTEDASIIFTNFEDNGCLSELSNVLMLHISSKAVNIASLALKLLNQMEWNLIGFMSQTSNEEFRSAFNHLNLDYNIHIVKEVITDIPSPFFSVNSVFDESKVLLINGNIEFVQNTLHSRALSRNIVDIVDHSIFIVTNQCDDILVENETCDIGCVDFILRSLEHTICLDESTPVKDSWIENKWKPHRNITDPTYLIDYRIPEMYDNGLWFAETVKTIEENPQNYKLGDCDECWDIRSAVIDALPNVPFIGLTKTNKFNDNGTGRNNNMMSFSLNFFSNETLLMERISPIEIQSDAAIIDNIVNENYEIWQDWPIDHTEYQFPALEAWFLFGGVICLLVFLLWFIGIVSTKPIRCFRYGVLTRSDATASLWLASILIFVEMSIFWPNTYFASTCFMKTVLSPSLRLSGMFFAVLCARSYSNVVNNSSLRIIRPVATSRKLFLTLLFIVANCLVIILCNILMDKDYDTTFFAIPGDPTILVRVCKADVLNQNFTERLYSQVDWILGTVFVLLLFVYTSSKDNLRGRTMVHLHEKTSAFATGLLLFLHALMITIELVVMRCAGYKTECEGVYLLTRAHWLPLLVDLLVVFGITLRLIWQEFTHDPSAERKRKIAKSSWLIPNNNKRSLDPAVEIGVQLMKLLPKHIQYPPKSPSILPFDVKSKTFEPNTNSSSTVTNTLTMPSKSFSNVEKQSKVFREEELNEQELNAIALKRVSEEMEYLKRNIQRIPNEKMLEILNQAVRDSQGLYESLSEAQHRLVSIERQLYSATHKRDVCVIRLKRLLRPKRKNLFKSKGNAFSARPSIT
eukprot:TRINITY_DN3035_c0_g1_i2.p1 TRINITY_DN3035_c0_g1~~TRINITY_DN3035_c0_g1_i2.p1  ORF type:complete len:849 (+),score=152.34 TRINITY_DN3035_c0_g1_i2:1333-3879(+)